MARPMLLALLCAAMLGWMVEAWPVMSHGPNQHLEGRDELEVAEPRQSRGPPHHFLPSTATTTTTLTLSVPGPTSSPSLTSTGLSGAASSSTTFDADGSRSWSTVDRQTSSEALVTATMPTDTTTSPGPPPTTDSSASSNDAGSGIGSNRTLVIALSTVFSAVGLALIAGVVWFCWRRRQRRLPLLSRGITPIDDDEIERWKSPREKTRFHGGDTDVEADAALDKETGVQSHAKHPSTGSVKKPPSVIVYNRAHDSQGVRHSTDAESRRSFAQNHPAYSGRTSLDKALPQTPIQARAPNARAGLTDESIPGDEPFLPGPRRSASRLSKLPPNSAKGRRARHARARSSRSSTRSFGEYYYYESGGGSRSRAGSDLELSPRHSHDHVRHSHHHHHHHSRNYGAHPSSHSRVYSSSSIPPRLSFGDEVFLGGLSPARPRFTGEEEIGRAIG
ncbi:hypothetical protein C8A00DRAFT_18277 [Chaetomidium leptoderma]|uniref:Uncharacterized protein n=1 Tax=Chaetomidium leptoderma TaxID=669021 RepID=A0AAN6VG27_9PEZI|nr:hypothetical protein C8A00DRAFT_18277 [Chaetomidium leptoderma]